MTAPEPAPPPFDLEDMKNRMRFIASDCARHMLRDCFAEILRLRALVPNDRKCFWETDPAENRCPLHGGLLHECPCVAG